MLYIIVFGVIIVRLIFHVISVRCFLVAMDKNVDNAMAQIDTQLSARWDVLTLLLDLIKGYAAPEYITISETIKAKRSITKHVSPGDIRKQEYIISEALRKIVEVAENYPDLILEKDYIHLMNVGKQYESMMCTSRLVYNDSVRKFNHAIYRFPRSLIAGILGFSKYDYFEAVHRRSSINYKCRIGMLFNYVSTK